MRADGESADDAGTRLISLLSRSMALFVRTHRQCSRGISQYASVSAKPSRTTFAASFSLIDSSSAATDSALAAEVNLNLNLSQSSPPGPLLVQDFHRSPNRLSY